MSQLQPEMSLTQQLAARIAMQSFAPTELAIMAQMAKGNQSPEQIAKELVTMFPTWEATSKRVRLIVQYLRLYGED